MVTGSNGPVACERCGEVHDPAFCNAHAKSTGRQCRRRPLNGATVCIKHGASTPQVKAAAARVVAMDKAVRDLRLGGRIVIDPAEAMLEQVYESQANVDILKYQVSLLGPGVSPGEGALEGDSVPGGDEDDELRIDDIDRSELGSSIAGRVDPGNWKAAPHVLVVMYNEERERLVRFSKACRDAGVEEHRVQLAGRMAEQLVEVNTAVLEEFIAWAVARLDQGGLTAGVLSDARRTVVPGLMRRAIEARVLGEAAS